LDMESLVVACLSEIVIITAEKWSWPNVVERWLKKRYG
jgi:hypothetical protein